VARIAVAVFLVAAAGNSARLRAQELSQRRSGDLNVGIFGMAGQGFHQELGRGQGFSEFGAAGLEAARSVSRRVELQIELQPLMLVRQPLEHPRGKRDTVAAFALDVGLRWFPGPADWRWAPYFEILDGPFYSPRRVPTTGSRFNFLTQVGFGADLPSGKRWHPRVFARWVHISDAGTGRHNPDWDYWAIGYGAGFDLPRK
jgi:hypothetical protein